MNYKSAKYRDRFIRGPLPDFNEKFVSYIGAAQTFGRFCESPFPDLVSKHFNIGGLNLGFGGAGPEEKIFYQSVEDINKSQCCVIQVMSGRSSSNTLMKIKTGQFCNLTLNKNEIIVPNFWNMILELKNVSLIQKIILNTISTYIHSYKKLLSIIECPKILLFQSQEKPKETIDCTIRNYDSFIGKFPHFITKDTLEKLKVLCDDYVEVVSTAGLPQKLKYPDTREYDKKLDFYKDKEVKESKYNSYYPSPEMHVEIKEKLCPVIGKFI